MTDWPTVSNILRSLPVPKDAPLWRRTQLRLQNMERFTARQLSTCDGCNPVIQAMESEITAKSQHLVARLREWEESQGSNSTAPLTRGGRLAP